jgi:hypothetical protein
MSTPTAPDDEYEALVRRFTADMYQGIETLERLGYPARKFKALVDRDGAILAAANLVMDRVPSYGLWRLKELGRLHMSAEMWVLLPLIREPVRSNGAGPCRAQAEAS